MRVWKTPPWMLWEWKVVVTFVVLTIATVGNGNRRQLSSDKAELSPAESDTGGRGRIQENLDGVSDKQDICNTGSRFECYCNTGDFDASDVSKHYCSDYVENSVMVVIVSFLNPNFGDAESSSAVFSEDVGLELRNKIARWIMEECSSSMHCPGVGQSMQVKTQDVIILRYNCSDYGVNPLAVSSEKSTGHTNPNDRLSTSEIRWESRCELAMVALKPLNYSKHPLNLSRTISEDSVMPARLLDHVISLRRPLLVTILGDHLMRVSISTIKSTSQRFMSQHNLSNEMDNTAVIVGIIVAAYILVVWLIACIKCIRDREVKSSKRRQGDLMIKEMENEPEDNGMGQKTVIHYNPNPHNNTESFYDNV